jgi:hypothetical protein
MFICMYVPSALHFLHVDLTRVQMGTVDRPRDPDIDEKMPSEYEMRKRFVKDQPEGWQPHLGLNVSAAGWRFTNMHRIPFMQATTTSYLMPLISHNAHSRLFSFAHSIIIHGHYNTEWISRGPPRLNLTLLREAMPVCDCIMYG